MHFYILTLFPKIFDSYFNESILKRAQEKKLITVKTHDIRDYTTDKHHTADDKPYGGGAGMVMKADPILKAIKNIERTPLRPARRGWAGQGTQTAPHFAPLCGASRGKEHGTVKVVLLSAKGKQFTQKMAYDWSRKYDQLVFISGRYEGIDERVKTILRAEEISIGPYVTTDGDVAAMVIISSVARLLPGVIRLESLQEESYKLEVRKRKSAIRNPQSDNFLEYPQYTRPEVIHWKGKNYRVPKVLLSGNHASIKKWRDKKRRQ